MKLSVYSLKKILFQGEARLLNCKTVTGEITVLDNHETLITVLAPGVIRVVEINPSAPFDSAQGRSSGLREHFFPINSGFLEVKENNEARVLVQD
ncbi:MAG: F0F1 ATP synthase subunit epsilon [Patescibacteria group bacterium]